MARLDQGEFELTMGDDIELAGEQDTPCLYFGPYIDSLDKEALEGLTRQYSVDFFLRNSVRELQHVISSRARRRRQVDGGAQGHLRQAFVM